MVTFRWSGLLALAVASGGCGGKSISQAPEETGGASSSGLAGSAGRHFGGATTTPGAPDDPPGQAGGGFTSAGQPGVGGNPNSPDGCSLAWWGGSLADAAGLTSCGAPDDPATLAYGQTQLPACALVTGPVAERNANGTVSCSYHIDESPCGSAHQADYWLDLPFFGDGTRVVEVPTSVSRAGCASPKGSPLADATPAGLAQQLIGVWLSCEGGATTQVGEAVSFKPDGSYDALYPTADGHLEPALGCDRGGLWGFVSGTSQLNLYVNGGTSFAFVTFDDGNPQRMTFSSGGMGEYIRVNGPNLQP